MRRHGFTLIELLVVIAIIAILAAILFPVFAKAREKARQSTCASNLKQIAIAMISYSQDYDELFPRNCVYNGTAYDTWWQVGVQPYVKNTQIVICPSSKLTMGYSQYIGLGYTSASTTGTSQANVKRPSQTIMCADSYDRCMLPSSWRRPTAGSPLGSAYGVVTAACGWRTPCAPHNEGGNFSFIDGHVKWLKAGFSTYAPGAAAAPENPTPDYRKFEGGTEDLWLICDK